MVNKKELLLKRLDEIGASLAQTDHGLALLGLGSVGLELDRLDDYSDLDFFAIVEVGYKQRFINELDWLSAMQPLVYTFRNTPDGYKALYADGIFVEFAVFEPHELTTIPFAEGRIVWQSPTFAPHLRKPQVPNYPHNHSVEWQMGELLTNLYVGMARYRRGEKLSAQRFIQHFAVDRLLGLAAHIETEQIAMKDAFSNERRFEQRYPKLASHLPNFVLGYDRSPESTRHILAFVEQHFEVNQALKAEILKLC